MPPPVRRPVVLALATGSAVHARGNATEPLEREARLDPEDEVRTGHRRPALLRAGDEIEIALDRSSAARVEERPDGEWRLTLLRGSVFLKVRPRPGSVVVATSHGEARVTGTAFLVSLDARRMTLSVLEGAVRLRGEKGEALVEAGRRSSVRAGERPSAPVRADVEAEAAWRRTLEAAVRRDPEPFIAFEPGANARLAGVVVSAPYSRSETDAGRLARTLAEHLDVGLVSGHHHRDRARRVWFNVDRGTEGEFAPDGTLGPARSTERARKVTVEYLSMLRAAAGVSPGRPVSLVVAIREHSETTPAGEELEVCEVAWTGWTPATIRRLKALYAQLLEKHRPAYRVDMKFEDLDATYEHRGQKRAFRFTESDAEADGYMARRNAQAAIAFFFNPSFGRRPEDFDAYARILGEMIEFLYAQR
ncbi:MAG TPA: FecR domain-containing protein [Planctomycetota bacterium]|nr:FecR domain-containing protein [Planctomycetota bacterium]